MSKPTLDERDKELAEAMAAVAKRLIEGQEELPPEFRRILDEHFWELLA